MGGQKSVIFREKVGFSPVFVISPGGTREKSEISKSILGFPLGFPETFMKNRDFRGFWGPGGVPVIKEGKAIALRTIDIYGCCCYMRNAMDPGFEGDLKEI